MKLFISLLLLQTILFSGDYKELSKNIIRELNYIYQGKVWTGGSTFKEGRKFRYDFRTLSSHEIEIRRSIDGVCLDEPFIIDLKEEYFVELEADTKCDPALIISHDLDIVYLYVKDRCGHFGGFNLYKRAKDTTVLLKEYFYKAGKLNK